MILRTDDPKTFPHTFIIKLVETCNLSCRYCYMFEFDKEISDRLPLRLSSELFSMLVNRIAEHVRESQPGEIVIAFHGGEPLMIGKTRFREFLIALGPVLQDIHHGITVQTNGVKLDEEWLNIFLEFDVQFCISFDSTPETNDRYRVDRRGYSTSDKVLKAIRLAQTHAASKLFRGIIAVIDPSDSGQQSVQSLLDLGLKEFDFLLPDANYASSAGHLSDRNQRAGEFLCDAFDTWLDNNDPDIKVRLFKEVVLGLFGRPPGVDTLGRINGAFAIIETDGGFLPHDVLRTCGPPWDRSQLNIRTDKFALLRDPAFYPWSDLSPQCSQCPVVKICGGGYPPHRFDGKGFNNPSIYCDDLFALITHAARRVLPYIPEVERHRYPNLMLAAQATSPRSQPLQIDRTL